MLFSLLPQLLGLSTPSIWHSYSPFPPDTLRLVVSINGSACVSAWGIKSDTLVD